MKNLKPYLKARLPFHEFTIARKRQPDLQARLTAIGPQVAVSFTTYDTHFKLNTLESIVRDSFFDAHSNDLQELYAYKSYAIKQFKKDIEDQQPNSIKYTCQSCGIDSVSSMDHFLPQELYPQYSANPYNLVPSCSKCNGHKSTVWLATGRRLFINPYLDVLPSAEFLFVDVFVDANNELNFTFRIANTSGINATLYSLIESHFKRLDLLKRMKNAAINHLTEFQNLVKNSLKTTPVATIRAIIAGKCADDRIAYGANNWKSALELALINSDDFLKSLTP